MKLILPIAAGLAIAACHPSASDTGKNDAASVAVPDSNVAMPGVESGGEAPAANVATANAAMASSVAANRFDGRWLGVEGMYLVVTPKGGDQVSLEMQWDLDHKGTFPGTVTAQGIRFQRNGVSELLRPTDGDATGLKYLAGKKDCLTVKPSEGYCRA